MKRIPLLFLLFVLVTSCNNQGAKTSNNVEASSADSNAESSQAMLTIDQVFDIWENKELSCKDHDILSLVATFNEAMPTFSVTEFLNEIQLPEEEQQYLVEVDQNTGYVSFAEGSDDQNAESMRARVWQRNDGHQLFAISFDQASSRQQNFALFYDYDPATGQLSPTDSPTDSFRTSFHNAVFFVILPHEGDDVVIQEYFMNWWLSIYHTYRWDGQNLESPETTVENLDPMNAEFIESYWVDENNPLSQYCLYDFDDDDNPELWFGSDNEETQAIYSIVQGEIHLLAAGDFKRNILFFPNVVGDAGGCGTGCFFVRYSFLENSLPKSTLTDMQSYNFEMDEMEDEYELNGEAIDIEQGQAMEEALGDPLEITPEWRPLY